MDQSPSQIVLSEGEGLIDALVRLTFVRAVLGAWPQARITWYALGSSALARGLAGLIPKIEVVQNQKLDALLSEGS